ncbi:MAG: SRPBCC family protein [Solirubrobacteraceae bacterium]
MATFTLRASIAAPVDLVFGVLTDHEGQSDMTALRSSSLEREGDPPPNGVGAIRRLTLLGPPIREQVTVFEPPHRFAYRMLSGVPIRSHTATVDLSPARGRHRRDLAGRLDPQASGTCPSLDSARAAGNQHSAQGNQEKIGAPR